MKIIILDKEYTPSPEVSMRVMELLLAGKSECNVRKKSHHKKENGNKPWTDEDDKFLREATKKGVTNKRIAKHLSRTAHACVSRMWMINHKKI